MSTHSDNLNHSDYMNQQLAEIDSLTETVEPSGEQSPEKKASARARFQRGVKKAQMIQTVTPHPPKNPNESNHSRLSYINNLNETSGSSLKATLQQMTLEGLLVLALKIINDNHLSDLDVDQQIIDNIKKIKNEIENKNIMLKVLIETIFDIKRDILNIQYIDIIEYRYAKDLFEYLDGEKEDKVRKRHGNLGLGKRIEGQIVDNIYKAIIQCSLIPNKGTTAEDGDVEDGGTDATDAVDPDTESDVSVEGDPATRSVAGPDNQENDGPPETNRLYRFMLHDEWKLETYQETVKYLLQNLFIEDMKEKSKQDLEELLKKLEITINQSMVQGYLFKMREDIMKIVKEQINRYVCSTYHEKTNCKIDKRCKWTSYGIFENLMNPSGSSGECDYNRKY